jgi:hypothetical protein
MTAIALMGFDSSGGVVIKNDSGFAFWTAHAVTATVTVNTDGSITWTKTAGAAWGPTPNQYPWFDPVGGTPGNSYWVRATPTSGTWSSGTTGSWLALSSARTWTVSCSSGASKDIVCTFEIASDAAGATIVGSASFHANVDGT